MTDRKPIQFRFWSISLALAFALLGIAAGCKGGDDSATAAPATAPTATNSPPPAAGGTPAPAAPGGSPGATTASLKGDDLFKQYCSGCHGDKGAGAGKAPVLAGKKSPEADVVKIVTEGKKRMPAFKGRLTDDQITAVAKYVSTL